MSIQFYAIFRSNWMWRMKNENLIVNAESELSSVAWIESIRIYGHGLDCPSESLLHFVHSRVASTTCNIRSMSPEADTDWIYRIAYRRCGLRNGQFLDRFTFDWFRMHQIALKRCDVMRWDKPSAHCNNHSYDCGWISAWLRTHALNADCNKQIHVKQQVERERFGLHMERALYECRALRSKVNSLSNVL